MRGGRVIGPQAQIQSGAFGLGLPLCPLGVSPRWQKESSSTQAVGKRETLNLGQGICFYIHL